MTPAVASERSIFSKNHDWNSYNYRVFGVAVNTYAPIFRGVDARGGRKLYTNRHTHTRGTATVTIIGASLSEPHTYRTAVQNPPYIYIYVCSSVRHPIWSRDGPL